MNFRTTSRWTELNAFLKSIFNRTWSWTASLSTLKLWLHVQLLHNLLGSQPPFGEVKILFHRRTAVFSWLFWLIFYELCAQTQWAGHHCRVLKGQLHFHRKRWPWLFYWFCQAKREGWWNQPGIPVACCQSNLRLGQSCLQGVADENHLDHLRHLFWKNGLTI